MLLHVIEDALHCCNLQRHSRCWTDKWLRSCGIASSNAADCNTRLHAPARRRPSWTHPVHPVSLRHRACVVCAALLWPSHHSSHLSACCKSSHASCSCCSSTYAAALRPSTLASCLRTFNTAALPDCSPTAMLLLEAMPGGWVAVGVPAAAVAAGSMPAVSSCSAPGSPAVCMSCTCTCSNRLIAAVQSCKHSAACPSARWQAARLDHRDACLGSNSSARL